MYIYFLKKRLVWYPTIVQWIFYSRNEGRLCLLIYSKSFHEVECKMCLCCPGEAQFILGVVVLLIIIIIVIIFLQMHLGEKPNGGNKKMVKTKNCDWLFCSSGCGQTSSWKTYFLTWTPQAPQSQLYNAELARGREGGGGMTDCLPHPLNHILGWSTDHLYKPTSHLLQARNSNSLVRSLVGGKLPLGCSLFFLWCSWSG